MPELATNRTESGWTTVAFGDVVRQVKDKVDPEESDLERYVAGAHMDTDDLHIRRWGEIGDGYLGPAFHMRFKPGHVLYGSRRTYLRKVALPDFEGITANTTYVLEPKDPDVLLPELLPFIMQAEPFHAHSKRESKGSVNPYVNFSDLAWYKFALPPLEEQRRIAEVLKATEALQEGLRELELQIERVGGSLFANRLDGCNSQPTPLGELLTDAPRNGFSPSPASEPTGYWVLALSAISATGYRPGEIKPVEETPQARAAQLRQGDLLISRSNTRELVGLPVCFPEDRNDVSYPDTMMRLCLDSERLRTKFVEAYLRSPAGRQQVRSYAGGTSSSMMKINGKNVRKIVIPLVRTDEQDQILRDMEAAAGAAASVVTRMRRNRLLKAQLIDDALFARAIL